MAGDHRQPGHTHHTAVMFIDDRHSRQQLAVSRYLRLNLIQEVIVDIEDNLQMARQDLAQHIHRPDFQRLAHQRMIGIGKRLANHLPGA